MTGLKRGGSPVKANDSSTEKGTIDLGKQGSITIPIYATTNRIYRPNPIPWLRELKSEHPHFTIRVMEF